MKSGLVESISIEDRRAQCPFCGARVLVAYGGEDGVEIREKNGCAHVLAYAEEHVTFFQED